MIETGTAPSAAVGAKTGFRWGILSLMWSAIAINYIDRTNLAATAPVIMKEFAFSPTTMGFVFSAFSLSYTLFQIPSGWLADRFGQRRILGAGVAWWSTATALIAFCRGLPSFIAARFVLGIGETAVFPSNAGVTAKWFPDKERARATTVFALGDKFGQVFAMAPIVWLMVKYGWRVPFIVSGCIGFIWLALWLKYYSDPEKSKYANKEEIAYIRQGQQMRDGMDRTKPPLQWYQLLRYRNVRAMCFGFFAFNYIFNFYITWFPTYLVRARGMHLMKMGVLAMIPPTIAMLVGFASAWVQDRLYERGVSKTMVRKVSMTGGMLIGSLVGLAGFIHTDFGAVALLTLSYSGLSCAGPTFWTLPGDVAPKNMTSTVGGVMNSVAQVGGILSPIVTGYIVSTTQSFVPALVVTAAVTLIGAANSFFYLGEVKHIEV